MSHKGLTGIQENCLRVIRDFFAREGKGPTRRELLLLTGQKSTHGVNQILRALEKKGYLRIEPRGHYRNLKLARTLGEHLSPAESLEAGSRAGGGA